MNNYRYLSQATSHKIKTSFGYNVSVDKSERETNYYLSKKETPEHGFIWITDGKGWKLQKNLLGSRLTR